MSNTSDSLPPYIYRPAQMMQHPPFMQKNSKMYGFFVKGDEKKLQVMLDRDLNKVARGQYNFQPLSDYMMLTFTNIPKDYSTYPEDQAKGWGPEIDVSIWVPVGNIVSKNGKQYLDEVFWYTPYIWVDSPITVSVGRDVYGYPKNLGQLTMPDHSSPDSFRARVNGLKEYSPDSEVEWFDLLSIKNLRPGSTPIVKWEDFTEAAKGIWEVASSLNLLRPDLHVVKEVIADLLHPQIPQIFLKQMPNGTGENAVYQALCSSPAKINTFHGGGLLEGEFQIKIEDVASFPLAEDLGLQIGSQTAAFGFWINMDFTLETVKELVNNAYKEKEKIAILGGGVSSVTAAFAITSQPDWKDKYDITFYQLGWRLGGKGASGRNKEMGERIEEHGLHIWFGFYENAFKYMQQCYEELARPAGAPLATWQEAFKKHSFIVNMENIDDEWIPWFLLFPEKPGDPGKGTEALDWWNLITTLYAYLKQWLGDLHQEVNKIDTMLIKSTRHEILLVHIQDIEKKLGREIKQGANDAEKMMHGILQFLDTLPADISQHNMEDHNWLKKLLKDIKSWIDTIATHFLDNHNEIRRFYIAVDLALTILIGMIEDDIFNKGFNVANNIDFKDWLKKYGANEEFTVNSAPVRALYDLVFGYKNGDISQANLEAGTGLRGLLLIGLAYKGAVMWKMQAGMGDTVFTPYYQVLKNRGVKFKFFHEVNQLELDPQDKSVVSAINMTQQVQLINGEESYEPLRPVKGLMCWPSQPRYGQILPREAAALKSNNIDLENFWTDWPTVYEETFQQPLPTKKLIKGKDFDTIIFGIPVASLPYTCQELLNESDALKSTHNKVATVVTQAYQLWTEPTLTHLGWTDYPIPGEDPVLGAWTEPVDTWAAMNQLICREDWSKLGLDPKNIAYYCGVQAITDIPPRTDYEFPINATLQVKEACISQMNHDMYTLWPDAGNAQQFEWSALIDPNDGVGEERFNAQYWRSNTSPTERYTLSIVNSTQYRINTKIPEFSNMYFTGDWIYTGLNAGCVEAATMAGLQTSRDICGYPKVIYGEKDFN